MFRRTTHTVHVGDLEIGSAFPIRVQSMTTTNTMDTQATVAQSIRMIEAGCELVRITAPSIREAKNLELIRKGLRDAGYTTPLVADIHFTPNAAEIAARLVEKVRVNPGNYADKNLRNFVEYSDSEYAAELDRIRTRFTPLVRICKEHGTAMRIGTNHGSLSDRIMSRFGDTPFGMVESALEFIKVAEDEGYFNIVLSMKSSNVLVMIQAYRLLVQRLREERLRNYPLHLGVTEAGDGDDGRIKSAIGIGTLLEDGIGDTIRVSLTEEPEAEIPVAQALANRYYTKTQNTNQNVSQNANQNVSQSANQNVSQNADQDVPDESVDKYVGQHARQEIDRVHACSVATIGGDNVPRVFADVSGRTILNMDDLSEFGHEYDAITDKWTMRDQAAEFLYVGESPLPFTAPSGTRQVVDVLVWKTLADKFYSVPHFTVEEFKSAKEKHPVMNVVSIQACAANALDFALIAKDPTSVFLVGADANDYFHVMREFLETTRGVAIAPPVILCTNETDILHSSIDLGALLADGFGNGVMMPFVRVSFGVLQATRLRMSKTEYISCPSCGRTLFDLQETTALIRSKTDHLKGLKIGIMGCIVNGPGEMADADYGYVGSGPEKISLYRGHELVKRNVPTSNAVEELIALIREDSRWIEPL
ncbi:MAG: (E)-4-hydroxy-3-methylbut-2-enyl-diphosphate synthase [Ignavibacteria bacterium]|nr:(E)-4-hydroxy-3-methylbut-2-enyl-diphosphate synthase [Ignavibacteria bacterium]